MLKISVLQKQIGFAVSFLLSFVLIFSIVQSLSSLQNTVQPEIFFSRMALALLGFLLPVLMAWFCLELVGGLIFSAFAVMMTLFVATLSKSSVFLWFLPLYILFCYLLYRVDKYYENLVAGLHVDREKTQNEMNDLEVSYRAKGEGISIYFEKYSTYYHLRKLAEELVGSLSVSQLSQMIVSRVTDFIPKGDAALIAISDIEGRKLSVIASRTLNPEVKIDNKQGDLFDFWVIRNRKRLIATDAHQDFRFDAAEVARLGTLRSMIVVPLLYEGRVMGTLRLHASKPEVFSNDDLRLLDAIGTLASSALSNAMLYEKTEELAIRDSLTGLYVRRHFFNRLKQEHRRFLLNQRPFSLLMCDLDHFKDCNDRFGHAAGDLMLIRFSEILKDYCADDLVARYGGEEFAVLLAECDKEKAVRVAEGIRTKVESTQFLIRRTKVQMTVSIGVATLPVDCLDVETLLLKADQALYQAKREGRNRVCSSGS